MSIDRMKDERACDMLLSCIAALTTKDKRELQRQDRALTLVCACACVCVCVCVCVHVACACACVCACRPETQEQRTQRNVKTTRDRARQETLPPMIV